MDLHFSFEKVPNEIEYFGPCREIHRMVEWLVSESMVTYYIHLFRDSMWPGGELAKPVEHRSEAVRTTLYGYII